MTDLQHNCRHKFEPRYDEVPNPRGIHADGGITPSAYRTLIVLKVYVRDVCVKCGRTVERQA